MFFQDLGLGRAWAIGVFAFVVSTCAWTAGGLFPITPLMLVSSMQLPDIFLCKPFFVYWSQVSGLRVSETGIKSHRQFKHAFPRCKGVGGGDLDLDVSKLIVESSYEYADWF